jgi:uncharacterized protein (DUF736 family)
VRGIGARDWNWPRLRPVDRHRDRDGRGLEQARQKRHGSRQYLGDGEFLGDIFTLSLRDTGVRLVPEASRSSDNAPSHRILIGRVAIGACWSKRSNEGRDYLSLKLDDPSFKEPIYANLFNDEGGKTLQPHLVPRPQAERQVIGAGDIARPEQSGRVLLHCLVHPSGFLSSDFPSYDVLQGEMQNHRIAPTVLYLWLSTGRSAVPRPW